MHTGANVGEEVVVSRFTEKMYRNARTTDRGMVTGEPYEPVRHTWGEVHERSRCIAGGLAAAGIGLGDAVGIGHNRRGLAPMKCGWPWRQYHRLGR